MFSFYNFSRIFCTSNTVAVLVVHKVTWREAVSNEIAIRITNVSENVIRIEIEIATVIGIVIVIVIDTENAIEIEIIVIVIGNVIGSMTGIVIASVNEIATAIRIEIGETVITTEMKRTEIVTAIGLAIETVIETVRNEYALIVTMNQRRKNR